MLKQRLWDPYRFWLEPGVQEHGKPLACNCAEAAEGVNGNSFWCKADYVPHLTASLAHVLLPWLIHTHQA